MQKTERLKKGKREEIVIIITPEVDRQIGRKIGSERNKN